MAAHALYLSLPPGMFLGLNAVPDLLLHRDIFEMMGRYREIVLSALGLQLACLVITGAMGGRGTCYMSPDRCSAACPDAGISCLKLQTGSFMAVQAASVACS